MSHKQGAIILVTYPLPDELDLRLLLYRSEAQLFLPRVVSRGEMEFRLWRDEGRELFAPEPGWHGIVGGAAAAPLLASDLLRSDARACGERRLALIPALALNRHFRRLGRGGGFYDRWKKRLDAWQKVALLPEELIEVNFTAEEHDLIVDAVVTDNGIREQDNSRTGLSDI